MLVQAGAIVGAPFGIAGILITSSRYTALMTRLNRIPRNGTHAAWRTEEHDGGLDGVRRR